MQHAGERDVVQIVSGRVGENTILPETRHAAIYQPGVARHAHIRAKSQALGDAGPKSFEQRIGAVHQTQHYVSSLRALEIHCDRSSTSIVHLETRIDRDAESARLGAIDANDVRAEIGEQHPAQGYWTDRGELNDFDTCQGAQCRSARLVPTQW